MSEGEQKLGQAAEKAGQSAPKPGQVPNVGGQVANGASNAANAANAASTASTATTTAAAAGETATVAGGTGAAAGATTVAAGATAAAAPLAIALLIIAVVVIIIIALVGIICFLLFMPGQISEKFVQMATEFLGSITDGKQNDIKLEEIAEVANYLEKMGYDLKGEGFVTEDVWVKHDFDTTGTTDFEQGVYRDSSDKVVNIYSEPIKTYIVSDNLCFLVKNANGNIEDAAANDPLGFALGVVTLAAGVILAFVVSPLVLVGAVFAFVALNGGNPNWGSGLISIWHEGSDIGVRGDFYRDIEAGSISLDPSTKRLKVERGWVQSGYEYNVDGWSGRYGMPLEFLLSVHLATQMPDLAVEMATHFDTDVEVLLHSVDSGEVVSGFLRDPDRASVTISDEEKEVVGDDDPLTNGDFITWDDIERIISYDLNKKEDKSYWDYWTIGWNSIMDNLDKTFGEYIDFEDFKKLDITDYDYYIFYIYALPHNDEKCTCCSHIPLSKKWKEVIIDEEEDTDDCKDSGNLTINSTDFDLGDHKICDDCKENIIKIIAGLKAVQNRNWRTYTPYISQVRNHWFRDIYFVIDDIKNQQVVLNDDAYYAKTNERWTLYETYEKGEDMPEGFVEGDCKLYEYDTSTGKYTLSTLSKDEVDFINDRIEEGDTLLEEVLNVINDKIDEGDESLSNLKEYISDKIDDGETSISRLVKKSKTEILSNILDDEGHTAINGINGNKWIAYEVSDDVKVDWTKFEIKDDSPSELQIFKDRYPDQLYYKEIRPGDIKQIEDGQRGPTNPDIKKMFIENKYYKYDGTVDTANKIMSDRRNTESYREYDNTDSDQRDESLIAKPSVTKDSLAAFAMLENTHTLDADYIYKDFKELIVELNYFDKEDLSEKISQVMTWPLPDTGSSGWPVRKYEKSEIFYGTLINSKADLELLNGADVKAAEELLGDLGDEGSSTETESTSTSDDESTSTATDTTSVVTTPSATVSNLVRKGYEVHKIMEDGGGWDYCILSPGDGCEHNYGHSCGLDSTIEEAQANNHNTCCATFISWVLKAAGFDLSSHPNIHGAVSTYNWCKAQGWTPITDYNQLQPGDLLFNKWDYEGTDTGNIGHVQMLGNNGEWLNAGSASAINSAPSAYTAKFIIGMRSKLTGAAQPFVGYKPYEPVVSPITGKVLEYGEVERTNVETGKKETVEFIKIEAMNNFVYDTKGEGYTECKGADEDNTFEEKASDLAKKLEGYDYFYDEYTGVIAGNVLYMEGFDLTLFDTDDAYTPSKHVKTYETDSISVDKYSDDEKGSLKLVKSGDVASEDVTRYKENDVNKMSDELEEAREWWKEDAKASALPLVEINGELYIKEGTVIGLTYGDLEDRTIDSKKDSKEDSKKDSKTSSEDEKLEEPNGNYIRLILRNVDDSIIEDIENYFDIRNSYAYNGSAMDIQNIDGMDPELEALIETKAGPLESKYPGIVNILKAISMNESGGGTNPAAMDNPMQVNGVTTGFEDSVTAAIECLTDNWDRARSCGIEDLRVVIQSYNYGPGFIDYIDTYGSGVFSKDLAESFSAMWKARTGCSVWGAPDYVDSKIYNYLPGLKG